MSPKKSRPKDERAAFDAASKILARGPFGAEGLIARLVSRGFDEPIARAGVERLAELGLLREDASAEAIVHATRRDLPAGEALLRARLEQRGVDPLAAEEALHDATASTDDAAEALQLAKNAARRLPARLDDASKARRLLGLLARRGFSEDHAVDAVRAVIPRAFEGFDEP